MGKKNFVLDTNVILHDHNCIENFQENDIYLPITVLEELDHFKKGSEQVNFNARAFARRLDQKADGALLTKGVKIGPKLGRLFVLTNGQHNPRVEAAFSEKTPDHKILSAALTLSEEKPRTPTILVTKDVNLRMKALSLGLMAQDYTSDMVQEVDDLFAQSYQEVEGIEATLIDALYENKEEGIETSSFASHPSFPALLPNQPLLLKSERNSALVRVSAQGDRLRVVPKESLMGISPRNAEQAFAMDVLSDPEISLVAVSGIAGTGKTLLALAAALAQTDLYQQILLARPIISLSNKDLGFLPGDYQQKVLPYMQPLFDNLNVIKNILGIHSAGSREIEELQTSGRLVIEALAYIRGRSLSNVIVIVDEAQNLTPQEIKTIITRAGENTKMIFTGDVHQIDSPYLTTRSNGLAYMIEKMRGQNFFAHVNLLKGERSSLSDAAAKLL